VSEYSQNAGINHMLRSKHVHEHLAESVLWCRNIMVMAAAPHEQDPWSPPCASVWSCMDCYSENNTGI